MDANDIFRKLSFGARFKPKNKVPGQSRKETLQNVTIKKEKEFESSFNKNESETVKIENDDESEEENIEADVTLTSEVIKIEDNEEIKDENDEENFTFLGDMKSKPQKKSKKKSKENSEEKKEMLEQEATNHYRNVNNISVVGRHVVAPIKSFDELKISKHLRKNIISCGYTEPTPVQKQAIPLILEERQLLACAPTGSGKTAAFLVPIIQKLEKPRNDGFRVIIISPTRELAKQTFRECLQLSQNTGLKSYFISKIKSSDDKLAENISYKHDILITTPNRLCFYLKQNATNLILDKVQWIVIDEADKLFESGVRSFRDQLNKILEVCNNSKRRIVMFSATHTPIVGSWCRHNMKGLITLTIGNRNAAAKTIDQELLFVGNESGKLIAIRDIIRKGVKPPVLIFVQSKERAQQLFTELIYDGLNVDAIHADRTQQQRDNTVRAFREGKIWLLISTDLMARGVDFKGVNLVINYDFPPSAICYIHRIGRAGRAGRSGKAITFFTTEDTINLRSIAQVLKQSGCDVPEYMLALKKRGKKHRKQLQISAPKRDDINRGILSKKKKMLNKNKEKAKGGVVSKKEKSVKKTKDTKIKKKEVTKNKNVVRKTKKVPGLSVMKKNKEKRKSKLKSKKNVIKKIVKNVKT